jgi:hypothetical protein
MRDKSTVRTLRTFASLLPVALLAPIAGLSCSNDDSGGLPPDVKAIVFLQRTPRGDQGNVFDYQSYAGGGKLIKLEPPKAGGTPTTLFPTADSCVALGLDASCVNAVDIMSYDINFNADTIVLSAKMSAGEPYQLFSIGIDGSNAKQLTMGGNDFVYPVYLPGGKIMFMSNLNVEQVADPSSTSSQFEDEYERATTAQAGTINIDGTGMVMGARNVSHRVSPDLLPDGQIVYTEWRHMGGVNDGHLRMMNTDLTGMREAFGGELTAGNPSTNSYLKARFVEKTMIADPDGSGRQIANYQMVAIATSRDRTLQSGKLFLINLNGSEAHSTATDLTPLIPGGRDPSSAGVGRYYDAEGLGASAPGRFLVSWSDGPVESETLALAGTNAQFGIYVFDSASKTRFPVFDDPAMWDVLPRPLRVRPEPSSTPLTPVLQAYKADTTIGALNVYDSSLSDIKANLTPGSVVKVRLLEGFSGEEGGVDMFGTTEFDGQSKYGELPVQADNSFAAVVPGNVPFHIQLVDKFGMSLANESIWISGRAGEQRFCGGCHENRTLASTLAPGIPTNVLSGAINLVQPRSARVDASAFTLSGGSLTKANPLLASDNAVKGVPWDMAIQPILDAKCASCHNGDASKTVMDGTKVVNVNPTYTITDNTTMVSQTFTFDLRGQKVSVMVGERQTADFTASYLSLMGLGEILSDADVTYDPAPPKQYVDAPSAMNSLVVRMLNPVQRFPVDTSVRAFPDRTFNGAQITGGLISHAAHRGFPELMADEHYLLILNIDMGGQFFFRENLNTAGSGTP